MARSKKSFVFHFESLRQLPLFCDTDFLPPKICRATVSIIPYGHLIEADHDDDKSVDCAFSANATSDKQTGYER